MERHDMATDPEQITSSSILRSADSDLSVAEVADFLGTSRVSAPRSVPVVAAPGDRSTWLLASCTEVIAGPRHGALIPALGFLHASDRREHREVWTSELFGGVLFALVVVSCR